MIKFKNNNKYFIMNNKKIYRSSKNKIIFGVCGGLAEYFEVDPLLIRILFLVISFPGPGIFLYLILAILMPTENNKNGNNIESKKRTKQSTKEVEGNGNWPKDIRNIVGVIIIIFGLNILFSNLLKIDILSWIGWNVLWSLVIIFIGIKIIRN